MAKKRKKRGRPPKNKKAKLSLKRETVQSILQIGSYAAAGLILVSFARQGLLLVRINDYLIQFLGWSGILLPFIFISFGFLVSKMKNPLGQPNVLVGALLFFISFLSLTQAGFVGSQAWAGMAELITPVGAFIVLLGLSCVGLIILFNTSVDQAVQFLASLIDQFKRFLVGDKSLSSKGQLSSRKDIKVTGVVDEPEVKPNLKGRESEPESPLQEKIVSNLPGDDRVWKYPPLSILKDADGQKADRGDIRANAEIIERTLESFGITAKIVEVAQGPTVTQYALEVALGTKLSKITNLERDLALALAAPTGTIRIEAPIPGRSLVGIELPNRTAEFVPLKRMMKSDNMKNTDSKLAFALGLDVSGTPIISDLGKMPHVLVAGQTGSGKSVCVNAILASMLLRASPSEVKFILVDPKRVELTGYNGIPHLLSPVIVEPEKVVSALRWILSEMERRYKLFSEAGARNIQSYNEMSGFQALPFIVLIIDELADVMLFSPAEVEDSITRIAQMSRATGIHMVLSTQRPSVDVITGLIKANIPSRIAFAVASQVDSRVILDTQGAEKLLGRGDMLYLPPEQAKPKRIQGAFISDSELSELTSFIRNQGVQPQYTEEVTEMRKPGTTTVAGVDEDLDELFADAVNIVVQYDRASASLLQRRLSVGYARAARILDQLEVAGVVSPADGSKPREILIKSPSEVLG